MEYLAGELPHRGANTDGERAAAGYILHRFRKYTLNASLDEFHSIESYYYLFASYYAEFAIVSILAFWSALGAFCYGAVVFVAYLAEFMGYHAFSRLMPHFETQNVTARFLAQRPKRLVVVSAHYDSPRDALFTNPQFLPRLRAAHMAVVACMAVVLITCAAEAALGLAEGYPPLLLAVRWTAVGALLSAAFILFHSAVHCDYVRGASGNASGVAALIELAKRTAETPLEETDLCLLATGSKETWMNGMHHFITSHVPDRESTYFINIEHVGAGQLHYLTGEGMLQVMPSAPELVSAAEAVAGDHGATPACLRAVPTDALVPLARDYRTLTLIALDEDGLPQDWHWYTDKLTHVDYGVVHRAADFAEAILRRLESDGP